MKEKVINFFKEVKVRFSWTRIWFTVAIIIILAGIFFGTSLAISYTYQDKVYPKISIDGIGIGGMTAEELKSFLNKMNDRLANEGLHFKYQTKDGEKAFTLYPLMSIGGNSIELINLDVEKEAARLISYKKSSDSFNRVVDFISLLFKPEVLTIKNFKVDDYRLGNLIKENVADSLIPPQDATVKIISLNPLDYKIVPARPGELYNYQKATAAVRESWSRLEIPEVNISKEEKEPEIKEKEVNEIIKRLPNIFQNGSLFLNYLEPTSRREYSWILNLSQIKDWLNVQLSEQGPVFGLDKNLVEKYLSEIVTKEIDVEAVDAKFKMDDQGKVVEFQGSRPGLTVDSAETYKLLNQAIIDRTLHDEGLTKTVTIIVKKTEPNVTTGSVNDLGIKELLGVGVSDYSNSPNNRIKNIRNAVKKLNGLLIKPDDVFSALKYTAPFTLEGGYFPELVIKGDELKPEIGGGLCQIGTTLFRMAMNSGMPITERRNHSLVVSHYNDPINNLPGTDATVYDPAPDFKFKNDTGNYILLQTYMDTKKQELVFTLWGTSDGRLGSYTHPVVLKWYPAGDPKNIETTKLEPGKKECQNPFRGADTSFVYTRVLADGQKEVKTFESHYRSLPKICLVGVAVVSSSTTDGLGLDVPAAIQ